MYYDQLKSGGRVTNYLIFLFNRTLAKENLTTTLTSPRYPHPLTGSSMPEHLRLYQGRRRAQPPFPSTTIAIVLGDTNGDLHEFLLKLEEESSKKEGSWSRYPSRRRSSRKGLHRFLAIEIL